MIGLRRIAEVHKKQFDRFLEETGTLVEVVSQAAKTTSDGSDVGKVLGSRKRAEPGTQTTSVKAIVHSSVSDRMEGRSGFIESSPVGMFDNSDIVLSVRLGDVLLKADRPLERTVFDTAMSIVVQGSTFEVDAQSRTGLPPIGPYILWVGLKASGR